MPRDPTGNYTIPPGTEGIPDTTIASAPYNGFVRDVETDLNAPRPLVAGGTGAESAAQARNNLKAEAATVQVTNYDTHVFEAGSFYSLVGATGAPNSTNVFCGIAYVGTDPGQVVNLEARVIADSVVPGRKYVRQKFGGVWGAWSIDASSSFVAKAGDTMTGDLSISKTNPSLILNKSGDTDHPAIYGYRNSVSRWGLLMGQGIAETGGNVGSDFLLLRYGDAGNYIDPPIHVSRATGNVTFSQTATAINGRLWGANDGSPVFKGAVNTITNPMTINGNLAGMWVCSFINNSAAASAGGIYTQVANDTNMSLAVLNAAGTQWAHAFNGNGNYNCSGNINTPAINTTGQSTMIWPGAAGPVYTTSLHIGYAGGGSVYGITLRQAADNTLPIIFMQPGGAVIGNISTTGVSTAYNTTSDGRLKEDLKSFDAGPIIDSIKVYDFAWKATGDRAYGVIAQETIEAFPQAVTHSKEIDVWGIDYAKYVPLLLQEIKALRERVAALEARLV